MRKFSEIGGKSETGGNAALPQWGWTPLVHNAHVSLYTEILDGAICYNIILNDLVIWVTTEKQSMNP